jgi:hypothetical protein
LGSVYVCGLWFVMELIEKDDWEWRWWWKIGLFEEDEKNKFLFFSLFLLFCS